MSARQPEDTRAAWDAIAADYDEVVTPEGMALGHEGLRRAALAPGMRFLDVAAGSGALSIPAARLGAQVTAVDQSPAMLERLRERARGEGLEVETRVMDGNALELPDGSFDVVGSQFGVMLFPDAPRALGEMARVTTPGGRVLMTVFGPLPEIDFFTFFGRALRAVVPGFTGPPPDAPPLPFQFQDPVLLRRRLEAAGLHDVRVATTVAVQEFGSGMNLWRWLTSSNPLTTHVLAELGLTAEQIAGLQDQLELLVHERAGGPGIAVLTTPIHFGIGTR